MKKQLFLTILSFWSIFTYAQSPNITLITTKVIGSTMSFKIGVSTNNTSFKVDWGNGITNDIIIESNLTDITGVLTGNCVKIYCNDVNYLAINSSNLTLLDVAECSGLMSLWCDRNGLNTLDVSKNEMLTNLYCNDNFITSLDVSKNIRLANLNCSYNQLLSFDISKNTNLTTFDCSFNQLKEINVSLNKSLKNLFCNNNKLSNLKLSQNNELKNLNCSYNSLNFNSLPVTQNTWTFYSYSPQEKITISRNSFNMNEFIDLSNQSRTNSTATIFTWKTQRGTYLIEGRDYSILEGKTLFQTCQYDSVFCYISNESFPNLILETNYIKVTQFTMSVEQESLLTSIYPNPIANQLSVESDDLVKRVEIYTILGAKVFEQAYTNQSKVNINATLLPKGMLVVKVYGKNGIVEKKIVKE